jgi:hypothetical protein
MSYLIFPLLFSWQRLQGDDWKKISYITDLHTKLENVH